VAGKCLIAGEIRRSRKMGVPKLSPNSFLRKVADDQGTYLQQLVNDLIRRDIDLIQAVG